MGFNSMPTPQTQGVSGGVSGGSHQCTCDSILSRLIYGYSNYKRTMESLQQRYNIANPFFFGGRPGGYLEPPGGGLVGGMMGGPFNSFYM